jgi:hypothetical protein
MDVPVFFIDFIFALKLFVVKDIKKFLGNNFSKINNPITPNRLGNSQYFGSEKFLAGWF